MKPARKGLGRQLPERIDEATFSIICALTQLLGLKDLTTGIHSSRMGGWALTLAKLLNFSPDEARDLAAAAVLHDIGKIGIPDAILGKPGKLTLREKAVMRKHPELGWSFVRTIPGCRRMSEMILHHHEMWSGGGYPSGLRGKEIPLGSRIVAIADAFDAMTTSRPYRAALSASVALERLRAAAGSQFDPELVEAFSRHVLAPA
jgi:HD-GYP domain-containing protein (c-di-GMP phosphodiesterase class II)